MTEAVPRYDPTVIPAERRDDKLSPLSGLAKPPCRKRDTYHYTISDYHNAFLTGRLTPSDVVEALLPLIDESISPSSKHAVAFLEVDAKSIRAAARASTQRYRDKKHLGVLDGCPVAVKDEIDLAGYSRCLGSSVDFTNPLDQTGWCVQKWIESGAIIIGKTNMHEVGMDTTGNNPNMGTPLNPHNEAYYCGGSSSGSAFAVSSGLCPIAHGADGGGSIRLPAGFCGIYGLKPSHGRVSGRPTSDICSSVGVHGPMASDLDSLLVAYRVMAQPDPENKSSRSFPNPMHHSIVNTSDRTDTKRIGIYRDWIERSDPEVQQFFKRAVDLYSNEKNYEIVDISIPYISEGQKSHALTILSEARSGLTSSQVNQLTYPNQLLMHVVATQASSQDLIAAQKIRNVMMEHLAWLWKQYPGMLIMTPTTPSAGWKVKDPGDIVAGGFGVSDGDGSLRSMEYVYLANWVGCPALSRPMGYSKGDEVPVGLMVCYHDRFNWFALIRRVKVTD